MRTRKEGAFMFRALSTDDEGTDVRIECLFDDKEYEMLKVGKTYDR